ncbi:MAG: MoaD family protein [Candidatus Bathyarchaeota archaeon]|nr:MoaD family protein [Candidatus Bathyarchaeota archaeon]
MKQIIITRNKTILGFGVALKIKVEYLGHIKNITGNRREEEVEAAEDAAVSDLLAQLSEKYGAPFRKAIYEPRAADVKPNYIVTVNGLLLNQLKGLGTKLKQGDHVILMPVVSGG